jgi:hypothetical protein
LFGRKQAGRRKMTAREETMEALIAGLVSIAVIWVVVIWGSIYMNKNVR